MGVSLGAAFKAIHQAQLPPSLSASLPHETYSPQWRETVRRLIEHVRKDGFTDPITVQLAQFLSEKADVILGIVRRAERLSAALQTEQPEFVLCHSDIHAGNVLVSSEGRLYVIDWDNPIMAAKERDLMFIGGGIGSIWNTPQEEAFFYRGYGQTAINHAALAYYRCERIVQDIAEHGEQIVLPAEGGKERERTLRGFHRWFQPNEVVEMAFKAWMDLPAEFRTLEEE